eukprot:6212187-Pleurochrysis_carterae.AAC.2
MPCAAARSRAGAACRRTPSPPSPGTGRSGDRGSACDRQTSCGRKYEWQRTRTRAATGARGGVLGCTRRRR